MQAANSEQTITTRAVERLISVTVLIVRLNCALIVVLMHILFVKLFSFSMFHLQVDIVCSLLLNAHLLLGLTTDQSD